jgi:hypothetical protein
VLFATVFAVASGIAMLNLTFSHAVVLGFDAAAVGFIATCTPLRHKDSLVAIRAQ